jgi:hypothetical protein
MARTSLFESHARRGTPGAVLGDENLHQRGHMAARCVTQGSGRRFRWERAGEPSGQRLGALAPQDQETLRGGARMTWLSRVRPGNVKPLVVVSVGSLVGLLQ